MPKKLIITGASSKIAQAFLNLMDKSEIHAMTCGRDQVCDHFFDFNLFQDCHRFVQFLKDERPDYLFLNHGALPGKTITQYSEVEILQTIHCNLTSQLLVIDALKEIEHLKTVITSSISGKAGSFDVVYASCKAAIDLAVKTTSQKLPCTSRLNAVSPGIIVDAKMTTDRSDKDTLKMKQEMTPTKEFTTSMEVAQMVYYLLITAQNINGENININGGLFVR
jgi:NAD(P)-dependent dehydrogenase (short-subunit alcohol dehydrogenase family)